MDDQQIDTRKLKELAELRVVLSLHGMQDVQVRRDLPYESASDDESAIDIYLPPNSNGLLPAVIFVAGYSDKVGRDLIGLRLKDWGAYMSWGQLVAMSGLVGITYSCSDPPLNAKEVLNFVREHAREFHIDPARIGIWAASGNGPTALSLLLDRSASPCFAVMLNTYMLDLDGDSTVADMSAQFGFAAPNSGKSVENLDPDVPLFVVRSGNDEVPGLNETIDRFTGHAVDMNLPVQLVNLPDAPHSFDTLHDTAQSRATIRQILNFMLVNSEAERRST